MSFKVPWRRKQRKRKTSRCRKSGAKSRKSRFELLEDRRLLSSVELLGVPVWQEQGPIGIVDGGVQIPDGRVSGAVQAIAVHPTDPDIAFIGTVNGGVWKTENLRTNPTSQEVIWQPLTDQYPSLSISTLAFSQLDSQILYAGTGQTSSFGGAGNLSGLLKTTDAGATWTTLGAGTTFAGLTVSDVLPTLVDLDPGSSTKTDVLLVATRVGANDDPTNDFGVMWLSTDGGQSFRLIGDTNNDGIVDDMEQRENLPLLAYTDVVADPANSPTGQHVFYAAVPKLGVFRGSYETNGTASPNDDSVKFEQVLGVDLDDEVHPNSATLGIDFAGTSNIKLATQRAEVNGQMQTIVYAGLVTGDYGESGQLASVVRSDDGGATWQSLGNAPNIHPGEQGHLHFSIAADPSLANVVYVGGDAHPDEHGGVLFRWQNGWEEIVFRGANDTAPHADSRAIVFETPEAPGAPSNMLQADDGGIFRLVGPNSPATRRWESLSGTLAITEQVSVAYDTLNNVLISGNQDNGVTEQRIADPDTDWTEVFGGDGGVQQVVLENGQSVRYSMVNNFEGFLRRTFDDAKTQVGPTETVRLARPGGGLLSGLERRDRTFKDADVIPYAINEVDPTRMLIGYHGLYEATHHGDIIRSPHLQSDDLSDAAGTVTALVYGGMEPEPTPTNPDNLAARPEVIYAARRDTLYVREPNGELVERRPQDGTVLAQNIRDIVVDPTNWRVAYVVAESQIWRTEDAGRTWAEVGNFLHVRDPGLRTVALASAEFEGQQRDIVFVGGDSGLFRAIEGDAYWQWTEFGRGLPNAPVTDVRYYSGNGGMLVAATLGRGTWTIENVDTQLAQPGELRIVGDSGDNVMAITRHPKNPLLLQTYLSGEEYVFADNGHGMPVRSGLETSDFAPVPVSSLSTIVVDGGAGDDVFRVSSTNGPIGGLSKLDIEFNGGDDNDTLRIRSESSGKPDVLRYGRANSDRGGILIRGELFTQTEWQDVNTEGVESHCVSGNIVIGVENVPLSGVDFNCPIDIGDGDGGDTEPEVETSVSALGYGLQETATLAAVGLFDTNLAVFGDSVGQTLDGVRLNEPKQVADRVSLSSQIQRSPGGGGDSLFRRMIETGDNAFRIADIGSLIDTPEQTAEERLRNQLDALDDWDGNVFLNPVGTPDGTILYDVKIVDKPISGTSKLEIDSEVFGGDLELAGLANITADVTMHIRFGVDEEGFFIDPEDNPDPEFSVRNIRIDGDLTARGRVGMFEVNLDDAELQYDPSVVLTVNLHDPGSGDADDGRIRLGDLNALVDVDFQDVTRAVLLGELGEVNNELFSTALSGLGSGHDVTLTATISPAPLYPGVDPGFFELAGAQVSMIWPNATRPAEMQINVDQTNESGQSLLSLLDLSLVQLVGGLNQFFTSIQASGNLGPFDFEIAFGGGGLDDIFSLPANELVIDGNTVSQLEISDVFEEDGFQKFEVLVEDFNFSSRGVAAGTDVHYRPIGGGELVAGTVETVDAGLIVVRYTQQEDEEQAPDRDDPLLQIALNGGLRSRIGAMLGNLNDSEFLATSGATIQDFLYELFTSNGFDLEQAIADESVSVDYVGGLEPAVEFTIPFDLEPVAYRQPFDLGGAIQGASFGSELVLDFTVDPDIELTVGLLLPTSLPDGDDAFPEMSIADRFYVSDQSHLTMNIDASWDGEEVAGSIGFLDVTIAANQSDEPAVGFRGDVGLRLHSDQGDGRIRWGDFLNDPTAHLEPFVENAEMNVNFKVTPEVNGEDGLGPLVISTTRAIGSQEDFKALENDVEQQAADYVNFDNLSPELILRALPILADRLRDLGAGSVLDINLPLINKSLAELADLGTAFSNDLDSLNESHARVASALAAFLGATEVSVFPDHILFRFTVEESFEREIDNLSLGVGEQLGLRADMDGSIDVSATASAELVLGLATLPDIPLAERIFLSTNPDDYRLNLRARADFGGYDLDGDEVVDNPPLDLSVSVLTKTVEAPEVRGFAGIAVEVLLQDNDGRLTLKEIADGNFGIEVRPDERKPLDHLQVFIPLDGDGEGVPVDPFDPSSLDGSGDAVVELAGRLTTLMNGGSFALEVDGSPLHTNIERLLSPTELDALGNEIVVGMHNLDEDFVGAGLLNFDSLWSGLKQFVDFVDQSLGTDILDYKLPIIGKSLRDGLDFVGDVRPPDSGVPSTLGELVGWIEKQELTGSITDEKLTALETKLRELAGIDAIEGLPLVTTTGETSNPVSVTFQFAFTPDLSVPLFGEDGFDFDLGVDFLNLSGENVSFTLDGQVRLLVGFGVDRDHGFFIKTFDEQEIQINPRLTLAGKTELSLGFVEVAANFDTDDFLEFNLSADLGPDGRLAMGELISGEALSQLLDTLSFSFLAQLNTQLAAYVTVGEEFPLVTTDLVFSWDSNEQVDPHIELQHLRIPVGQIVNSIGGSVVEKIREYNPFGPIAEELGQPLPVIGESLLDIFERHPDFKSNPIYNLLIKTSDTLNTIGNEDFAYDIGSVLVARNADGTAGIAGGAPDAPNTPGEELGAVGDILQEIHENFGITFPILDLGTLFNFLVAEKDVDIVRFVPPTPLEIFVGYGSSQDLASLSFYGIAEVSANASFTVGIGLKADITAGLDTRGLRPHKDEKFGFLDGIWIGDFDEGLDGEIEPGDFDIGEIVVWGGGDASISGTASLLGFDIASLRGFANITAEVGINLNDDNSNYGIKDVPGVARSEDDRVDGKFHLDEIAKVIEDHGGNPLCMFDLTGAVRAGLGVDVKVDLGIFGSINEGFEVDTPIVDFEVACPAEPPPDLLAQLNGNELVLTWDGTTSDEDIYHTTAATNHPDGDEIRISRIVKDGEETLRVQKGSVIEDFGPKEPEGTNNYINNINNINLIRTPVETLGAGPDRFIVDASIFAKVEFHGGGGNDYLVAGGGGGTLIGGEGNDTLIGDRGGPVILVGGGGDDVLRGGPSSDILVGDYDSVLDKRPSENAREGSDTIYAGGTTNVEFVWGDNKGDTFDDDGQPAAKDRTTDDQIYTGVGAAVVYAGAGNDKVQIHPSGSGWVEGGDGDDNLTGGGLDDVLIGQDGDDVLIGGEGDDQLFGGEFRDLISGRDPATEKLGNDRLFGGGGNDFLDGYDSTFVIAYGNAGNDTIVGSFGSDNLYGNDGNDMIAAGAGNDLVRGGTGDDAILGGAGSIDNQTLFKALQSSGEHVDSTDRLFGDDGDDVILGDNGTIQREIISGDNDQSDGYSDYHRQHVATTDIFQGGGIDVIVGGKGDDELLGGTGGDFIYGDSDYIYFQGTTVPAEITPEPGNDTIIGDEGTIQLDVHSLYNVVLSSGFTTEENESTYIIRTYPVFLFSVPSADTIAADELDVEMPGGDDLVFGGEAGDLIRSSAGEDIVFGDLAEHYEYRYSKWTYQGSQTFEFISEHEHRISVIEEELGGNDVIDGGLDDDILIGGTGGDELSGGFGTDFVFGDHASISFDESGNAEQIASTFTTLGGNDQLTGGEGVDAVLGGYGDDALSEESDDNINFLLGDSGKLVFETDGSGSFQIDLTLVGEDWTAGGSDEILGSDGDDYIAGGPGDDTVYAGAGDDRVFGDLAIFSYNPSVAPPFVYFTGTLPEVGGHDQLFGEAGFDRIEGGAGDDTLSGGLDQNLLDGGAGTDWVVEQDDVDFYLQDHVLQFGPSQDDLLNIEKAHLTGGDSNNIIDAFYFSGMTTLIGGRGDDELFGGLDTDFLFGGDGSDLLVGGSGDDNLIGGHIFEELSPDDADDELHGGEGDDVLLGQLGGDFLDGGAGHDRIDGGEGDNTHLALSGTSVVPEGLYHTFTVTNTAVAGDGSLVWAVSGAENLAGEELAVIDFQIPTSDSGFHDIDSATGGDTEQDVFTIFTDTELAPFQRGDVTVNGLSQAAFLDFWNLTPSDPNPAGPEIVLDGRYQVANGLRLFSDKNAVYGLNIQEFERTGIIVSGSNNVVAGNYIGVDPTASVARGNLGDGVALSDATDNSIGIPELGNVIGGNQGRGIFIGGIPAARNRVVANFIGTDPNAVHDLGNASDGIQISGFLPENNQVGGTEPGTGNIIANNAGAGVRIAGVLPAGNTVRGNSIFDNDGLGIDLDIVGVTPNDPLDADSGPNGLQNFPEILVASAGAQTHVAGVLHSTPGWAFELDFFANSISDPSGFGEGARYLGSATLTTDAVGNGSFDATFDILTLATESITATATDVDSQDTSEFSAAYLADDSKGSFIVTNTADSGPGSLRSAIEAANGLSGPDVAQIMFAIPATDTGFVDVDAHLPGGDADPDAFVISPLSELPVITRGNIVINGQSQQDSTGDTNPFGPEVVLAGNLAGDDVDGLHLASSDNLVNGLNIQQFSGDGILISSEPVIGLNGVVDKNAFVAATGAEAVAEYEPSGTQTSYTTLDGALTLESVTPSQTLIVGSIDWTDRIDDPTLAINGREDLDINLSAPAYAFGFDFVEPEFDPRGSADFVDSTFSVTLKLGSEVVDTFNFNASNDIGTFIGASSLQPFDRVEIREVSGGIEDEYFGRMYVGKEAPTADNNTLTGNYIGTNATGTSVQSGGNRTTLIWPTLSTEAPQIVGPPDGDIVTLADGAAASFESFTQTMNVGRSELATLLGVSEAELGAVDFVAFEQNGLPDFGFETSHWLFYDGTTSVSVDHEAGGGPNGVIVKNGSISAPLFNNIFGVGSAGEGVSVGYLLFDLDGAGLDVGQVGVTVAGGTGGTIGDAPDLLGLAMLSSGAASTSNGGTGVHIVDSSGNVIGGVEPGAGNVISGNSTGGIWIDGSQSTGNQVAGNTIGLASDGVTPLGNGESSNGVGVLVQGTPEGNVIGGTTDAERNVISGNGWYNVHLAGTQGTTVQGNYIGVDQTGAQVIPVRARNNVRVDQDQNSLIGGATSGAGNVIAGASHGIYLVGYDVNQPTEGTRIQGNRIGTTADGKLSGANIWGVYVDGFHDSQSAFEVHDVLIGGDEPDAGNLISGNQNEGVHVHGPGARGIAIQGNRIGTDIDGVSALPNGTGVMINDASGVLIGGDSEEAHNVISGNASRGISIVGGEGNTIQGNIIGLAADGITPLGNVGGINITNSSGNVIGGATDAARNVISASTGGHGVAIQGVASTGNLVEGNYIGTDDSGTLDRGNHFAGVLLQDTTTNTLRGNVISGNGDFGVYVVGIATTDVTNYIEANYIGTDATGTRDLGNTLMGVRVLYAGPAGLMTAGPEIRGNVISGNDNANIHVDSNAAEVLIEDNLIGTDYTGNARLLDSQGLPGSGVVLIGRDNRVIGNVISANPVDGVIIDAVNSLDGRAAGNMVQRNLIGVGAGGASLGNGRIGVHILRGASNNLIGTIKLGPDLDPEGNVIAHNASAGVAVGDSISTGNTIRGNSIHSNGGLGIDLAGDDVTANDYGDPKAKPEPIPPDRDLGPNNLQNYPDIRQVTANKNGIQVNGQLHSDRSTEFVIDFYAGNGNGEGKRWLGSQTITTGDEGVGAIKYDISLDSIVIGEYITTTATNSITGDTSEFSAAVQIVERGGGPDRGGPGGGGGPSLIIVDSGDDKFSDGVGQSITIAGLGVNRLVDGKEEDVLIEGTTNLDLDDGALSAAFAAWSDGDTYSNRVNAIDALFPVGEDEEADKLTGSSGRDLFFSGLGENLTDVNLKNQLETVI